MIRKKKVNKLAVKEVKLVRPAVVRVTVPPAHHPVIIHKEHGVVEIVPAKAKAIKEMGWLEYLFGAPSK